MNNLKMLSLGVLGLTLMMGCATGGSGHGWSLCGNQARRGIVDLDISPDPSAIAQESATFPAFLQKAYE